MKALYRSIQALTGVPEVRVKKAVPKGRKKRTGETSSAVPDAAVRVEPPHQEEATEAAAEPRSRERVGRVYILDEDQEEDEDEESLQDRRRKRKERELAQSSEGARKRAKGKGVALSPGVQGTEREERMADEGEEEAVLKILPGNWMVKEGDTLLTPGVATQLADFIDLEGEAYGDIEGDAAEQIELMLRGHMKEMLRTLATMRQWQQHLVITETENQRLRMGAAAWEEEKAGLVAEIATLKGQVEKGKAAAEAAERERRKMEEVAKRLGAERDRAKREEIKTMALLKQTIERNRKRSAKWASLLEARERKLRKEVAADALRWYKDSAAFKEDAEAYLARGTFLFMKQVAKEVKEAAPDCDVRQIPALGPFFAVEEAMKNAPQPEDIDSVEEWSSAEEEVEEEETGMEGKAGPAPQAGPEGEAVEEGRPESSVPSPNHAEAGEEERERMTEGGEEAEKQAGS